ncbi:MAG: Ger(x)C family spore germination protein [Clostridiaceae bacterium]|nr:Ger(x)C family spore germination protein [Clostridiaceae bacterium]
MKRRINRAVLSVVLLLAFFPMSGCFDSIEVDEMAYVVSLGIDKGSEGNMILSFLIAVPISVGVGGEIGEVDKSTTLIIVEAPTIYGGVSIVNSLISKRINFSHTKLILISKEVAQEGVEKYINAFIRFREFRPNTYIGISRGRAEDFLNAVKPVLEINPAKFFELFMVSYKYTGYSSKSELEYFYLNMECTCSQPVAALLDINDFNDSSEFKSILSEIKRENGFTSEGNYKAGDIPIISDTKSSNMGLAVFRGDKMVGEMNGRDVLNFLIVTGQLGRVYFTLPDPEESDTYMPGEFQGMEEDKKYVSLRLGTARRPSIKTRMKGSKPIIDVSVFLEGDILSIDGDQDYSTGEGLTELEQFVSDYIKRNVTEFLIKTRDEFKSDICATGRPLKKTFLLWDDWIAFKWMDKYPKAEFNVDVKVLVRRSGVMTNQVPLSHMKGKDK